jgi:hypothetical protein
MGGIREALGHGSSPDIKLKGTPVGSRPVQGELPTPDIANDGRGRFLP